MSEEKQGWWRADEASEVALTRPRVIQRKADGLYIQLSNEGSALRLRAFVGGQQVKHATVPAYLLAAIERLEQELDEEFPVPAWLQKAQDEKEARSVRAVAPSGPFPTNYIPPDAT